MSPRFYVLCVGLVPQTNFLKLSCFYRHLVGLVMICTCRPLCSNWPVDANTTFWCLSGQSVVGRARLAWIVAGCTVVFVFLYNHPLTGLQENRQRIMVGRMGGSKQRSSALLRRGMELAVSEVFVQPVFWLLCASTCSLLARFLIPLFLPPSSNIQKWARNIVYLYVSSDDEFILSDKPSLPWLVFP